MQGRRERGAEPYSLYAAQSERPKTQQMGAYPGIWVNKYKRKYDGECPVDHLSPQWFSAVTSTG